MKRQTEIQRDGVIYLRIKGDETGTYYMVYDKKGNLIKALPHHFYDSFKQARKDVRAWKRKKLKRKRSMWWSRWF